MLEAIFMLGNLFSYPLTYTLGVYMFRVTGCSRLKGVKAMHSIVESHDHMYNNHCTCNVLHLHWHKFGHRLQID